MLPRISQCPHFPAPEYSVLKVLLLETEVGGYRGSRFVQYIHMYLCVYPYICRVGSGREGRGVGVGANNTNYTISEQRGEKKGNDKDFQKLTSKGRSNGTKLNKSSVSAQCVGT